MRQTVSSEAQAGHKDLSLRLMLRFADLPMPSRTAAAHGAVDVRLHLLGSPKLALANGRELALERKDAALLALLVLDGPTARAQAAAMVWPDVDDNRARNSLRQRLFRLRRATGRDVVIADSMLRLAGDIDHDLAALPQRLADDPDWGRAVNYSDSPTTATASSSSSGSKSLANNGVRRGAMRLPTLPIASNKRERLRPRFDSRSD